MSDHETLEQWRARQALKVALIRLAGAATKEDANNVRIALRGVDPGAVTLREIDFQGLEGEFLAALVAGL